MIASQEIIGNWLDPLIALLVVANLLPILPILLNTLGEVPRKRRRRVALNALFVGNLVAFLFAIGGGVLLDAMRSRVDDLRIAGGLILLVFAIYDLLFSREQRKEPLGEIVDEAPNEPDGGVGVVPLGVPMMVGPATLTTALVVGEAYGLGALAFAMLVNGLGNVALLAGGDFLMERLGHGTIRASGKVFGLLLATLAVTMIRTGVTQLARAS